MSYYQYQARDSGGEVHKGVLEAVSELDAARKLKSSRLFPVSIKAVKSRKRRRVPEEHVIRFFFDLSELLYAGLPVDRALALTTANQTNKGFQRIVKELMEDVQGGSDLSGALGKYRDVFGTVSDHMIRAGEASGTLGPILKRLAEYMEQRREFRQTLISAMIYPLILLGTSLVSMVILLVYVVPKFAQIFHDLHQKVPFVTDVMLQMGTWLRDYGWTLPVIFGLVFWGGKYLVALPPVRMAADKLLFRFPLTRYVILNSELTRLCQTVGTMIEAGVPLLRALDLGQELILNVVLKKELAPLHQEIKAGRSISNYFRSRDVFPARLGTMLRISEEHGDLGAGLLKLSVFFEKEMQRTLQRLMALMGPMVIILTGGIIAVMVMSMFSAIYGINEIKF